MLNKKREEATKRNYLGEVRQKLKKMQSERFSTEEWKQYI